MGGGGERGGIRAARRSGRQCPRGAADRVACGTGAGVSTGVGQAGKNPVRAVGRGKAREREGDVVGLAGVQSTHSGLRGYDDELVRSTQPGTAEAGGGQHDLRDLQRGVLHPGRARKPGAASGLHCGVPSRRDPRTGLSVDRQPVLGRHVRAGTGVEEVGQVDEGRATDAVWGGQLRVDGPDNPGTWRGWTTRRGSAT